MFSGGGLLKIIKSEHVVERSLPEASAPGQPAQRPAYQRSFEDGVKQGREEGRKAGMAEGLVTGRKQGVEEGRQAGMKEGEAKSRAALAAQFALLAKVAAELDTTRNGMVREAEQEVLKLSLMVAEKVVRTHLEQDPNLIEFVRQLLAVVTDKTRVVVRLCPENAQALGDVRTSLAAGAEGGALNIVSDDRLSRGDCVVETNSGNFDARVSSQMSEIRRQLEGGQAQGK